MGLFKIFSGKSPADYERNGDAMASSKAWGDAKLAFESALDKLAKQSTTDSVMQHRLQQKLHQSKEALADAQCKEAMALMDAGCAEEALELFTLAAELTTKPQLETELNQHIEAARRQSSEAQNHTAVYYAPPVEPEGDAIPNETDDHFNLLLGTLPEEIQHAYSSYGYHFKQGYVALNLGDFDQAVEHLTRAVEQNESPNSLVPLELATAHVNMSQSAIAQPLLEEMLTHNPGLLPAIQLLCEIYWENKDFDQAMQLLDTLAPEQAQSVGAFLLRGETLLQAARHEEAKSFFEDLLENYGWNEQIALGLARAFEGLDQTAQARDMYGQLISQCSGCGSRIDPSIKRKFADLSLASGDFSTKVLELYLSLSQEDPANAMQYCENISRIYKKQGHEAESTRFRSIAEDLARNRQE